MQELGEQAVAGRRERLSPQVLGQVAQQPVGDDVREHRRHAAHQDRVAAERLDLEPEWARTSSCSRTAAGLRAGRSTGSGTSKPLRLDLHPCSTRSRSSS